MYTAKVGIGDPPTYYNLTIDTGSANTFCGRGTGTPYVRTPTSIATGQDVHQTYGSGSFTGKEYLDQVTIAPNLVITNQSIGDALTSAGFDAVDGMLGLAPADLTLGSLGHDKNAMVPTVMDNLVSQNLLQNKVIGVYLAPPLSEVDKSECLTRGSCSISNPRHPDGVLTYGGVDTDLFNGELMYAPVTETYPASTFWGINITSSTYGNCTSIIPNSTAGIVDTGTAVLHLADDFFDSYINAIPAAKWHPELYAIELPADSARSLQPLQFVMGDNTLTLDAAAQVFPLNETAWWGVPGKVYSVISKLNHTSGTGLDFILGMKFLERYYSVYDADQHRVGSGLTNNTFSREA